MIRGDGVWARTRTRIGTWLILLGGALHLGLADIGMWIEPRLADPGRRPRPWPGLLIVALLVAGLAFVGQGGVWLFHEAAPHREDRS